MRGYVFLVRSRDPLQPASVFPNRSSAIDFFNFGEWLSSLRMNGTGVIFSVPLWGRYDGLVLIDTDYYIIQDNEELEFGDELLLFNHCLDKIRNRDFVSDTTTMIALDPMEWIIRSTGLSEGEENRDSCFAVLSVDTEVGKSRVVCKALRQMAKDGHSLIISADSVLGSRDIVALVRRPSQRKFYAQFIDFKVHRLSGVVKTTTQFIIGEE